MRKFRFNLQRLLDYRETVEEALLAELAAVRAEHEREQAKLAEMVSARERARQKMRKRLSSGSSEDIKQTHTYLQQLTKQVTAQEELLCRIAERRERKTEEVIEAAKDRKVLERLREYKVQEHRLEAARLEQKFLDDLGAVRHERVARDSGYPVEIRSER